MLYVQVLGLFKKGHITRITPWPSTFNVINPELIQFLGNTKLGSDGKGNALRLRTIAQGGVHQGHVFR